MADEKPNLTEEKPQLIDYREVGASGLRRFSGFIFEEFLQELTGWRGAQVYKEMGANDAVVGAMLYAIRMMIRRVPWLVKEASSHPNDIEAADFLETCQNDMAMTWVDTIDEIMSMLLYGFSVHEIVYKRRCGDGFDPSMRSKYKDGRIGWRKLPIRAQDTIYRWQFDDHGGIQGVEQLAPPHYYHVTIPIEKMLLFRTDVTKNNPEGRSLLRNAYRSWYLKKNIENIEGIGIERDLAGLPVALVDPTILSSGASAAQKNLLADIKNIVINIRRDAQEGVVFPMAYNTEGKLMYELKLMSTGGQRQFDTDKIINRYSKQIAMTTLSDFILMGQDSVGSFALSSNKMNMFATSVGAILDMVCEVFNRFAIPRLFGLNDFQISEYPRIDHGDIEATDLKELGDYILKLAQAGAPIFPNLELEKFLMNAANLPEPSDPLSTPELQVETPMAPSSPKKIVEIPENGKQLPNGANIPADTTPVNGAPPPDKVITNASGDTEDNYDYNAAQVTAESLRAERKINLDY